MGPRLTKVIELSAELQSMGPSQTGYTLIGERVAVLVDEGQEKTEGGLYIPDSAKQVLFRGSILLLGIGVRALQESSDPEKRARYAGIEVGKRVTFNRWNPAKQELKRADGSKLEVAIMHAMDIYLVWGDSE